MHQIRQENQLQVGVIDSWCPSLNPPKACTVWHCFCPHPSCPGLLSLSSQCGGEGVVRGSDFLLSMLVVDHRLFFSGEWCLTHPSVALSCPVDSCYSLWRSQSVGPDEQGLLHLTGRFLSTWNPCRDKGRRWKGSVKWKFSRCVHITVKPWIFGCPSCSPLSLEYNITSWTDALIFSTSLQIFQGDRKLWWCCKTLQGVCFLSEFVRGVNMEINALGWL